MSCTNKEIILRYAQDCETFECFATNILQKVCIIDILKVLYQLAIKQNTSINNEEDSFLRDLTVDTLIKVRNRTSDPWSLRYFAYVEYNRGQRKIFCYADGYQSKDEDVVLSWNYAQPISPIDIFQCEISDIEDEKESKNESNVCI